MTAICCSIHIITCIIIIGLCLSNYLIYFLIFQEPMKSKAPQLHLEYRFYKLLGSHGKDYILMFYYNL